MTKDHWDVSLMSLEINNIYGLLTHSYVFKFHCYRDKDIVEWEHSFVDGVSNV